MALPDPQITPAHARRFRDEGWFVIERALAPTQLETLRRECRRLVDERDAEMTRLGVDTLDLCHRGRRYFLHAYASSPAVRQFLFSDLMADVAQAVLFALCQPPGCETRELVVCPSTESSWP